MKKLGIAIAALLSFTVLAPVSAEAGGCRTRVTYESCGTRLNWEYRFVGRDCHGCPVFQWVVVSRCAPTPPHHGGYSHGGGHYSGGYSDRYPRISYPGSGSCGHGRSSYRYGR